MTKDHFRYHKALVTGASSGLGELLAHFLADKGIELIVTGRDSERLRSVHDAVSKKVPARQIVADLTVEKERALVVRCIRDEQPDLLVNSAGMGLYGEVLGHHLESLQQMVDLNVSALMELTVEGAKALVSAGKQGVILNISSTAGYQLLPRFSVYAASKAFVTRFSESMDCETRQHGVRVLTSCPGVVATRFQQTAMGDLEFPNESTLAIAPEVAVRAIWKQLQSHKSVCIFDWRYKFLCFLSQYLAPRWLTLLILRWGFLKHVPEREIIPAVDPKPPSKPT